MLVEQSLILCFCINLVVTALVILGTGLLVWKLNFKDKNNRLLFILYIVYWMAPLFTREYTGQMHLHMFSDFSLEITQTIGYTLFIPLLMYGLIGIIWRPLSEVFGFRMKSRRNVLLVSLGIELATVISFLAYPCFATNIIQSIGAGIGASCIGLFNLMFDESYHHRKVLTNVSIVALPPLIAELLTSTIEGCLLPFLPENAEGNEYTNVMIFIWVFALISILAAFIIAILIKEKQDALYLKNKERAVIRKTADKWILALLCVIGASILFVRWSVAGPTATSQLIWMCERVEGYDARYIEAYLTVLYAAGQLLGSILAGIWMSKSKSKVHIEKPLIVLIAIVLWILYLYITANFVNVPTFYGMNVINGLAFGLVWNIMLVAVMNLHFAKTKLISPIGIFNLFLSLGICSGTIFVNWEKGDIFNPHTPHVWETFIAENALVNYVCMVVLGSMIICFGIAYILRLKNPLKMEKIKFKYNTIGESEI